MLLNGGWSKIYFQQLQIDWVEDFVSLRLNLEGIEIFFVLKHTVYIYNVV
jgi:hypothetical protein